MAGVVGAHHTSFTVAEIDRSIAFLRDQLGLELLYRREVRADYFAQIVGLPGCVVVAAGPNRGGYGVYLRDPNGILIELFQPPRQDAP